MSKNLRDIIMGVLVSTIAAGVGWSISKVIEHGERIAVTERAITDVGITLDDVKDSVHRIEDRLINGHR